MEELSFDNILGEQEIETLFVDPEDSETPEGVQNENPDDDAEESDDSEGGENETKKTTEVVNPEELFGDEQPESVGSGKDNEGKEDAAAEEDDGTSPNNFYSSIANACAVDGIFPNLDEETVKKAVDAESFSALIDAEINARFDEKQLRISQALENGVEPSEIRKYENTLNYVNNLTDADIAEESEKGEQLRYNLIYQDFLNRGMAPEKAKKLTERTIDAGTDVEDAKEALQSNKEYFSGEYNKLLKEAQKKADEEKEERVKQAKSLETSLMKDKELMGNMEISSDVRKKAFESVSKPIYKDPESGGYMTAIQKYQKEHPAEFLKYSGLLFAMTDGFKDFKSFIKGEVKKEKKKGLRELEQVLNTTRRNNDGSLRMVTKRGDDSESFITKGFKLDL